MKTIAQTLAKRIAVILMLLSVQSCVRFDFGDPHRTGGRAFVRMNWYDYEPSYVDADGLVPYNFYWDTYYSSTPGYYSVYYEYSYRDSRGSHLDAYTANVKVWTNYSYSSRYSNDNYFDLTLYPDGYADFYLKSGSETATNDTASFKTTTKTIGNTTFDVTYKKVQPRKHD